MLSQRYAYVRLLHQLEDQTVELKDHRRRVDLPGTLDVAADVLRMDRDQLASAVGVRPARDRALGAGVEPSTEARRSGLDVRRIARIGNEQGVNPARIDAVEPHVVEGRSRADVDRQLVAAIAIQVGRAEHPAARQTGLAVLERLLEHLA